MNTTNAYDDVIYDGESKPYRYRRGVYPTLFWLARHPDRFKHDGLSNSLLGQAVLALVLLGWIGFSGSMSIQNYRQTGTVDTMTIVFTFLGLFLLYNHYRESGSLMKYAAAIDLAAKTCPACGYPLAIDVEEDRITDAMCSECGRRWTLPPREPDMDSSSPINTVNYDGQGNPYRYRQWTYPTLHWLMCHPDGGKLSGLFMHIWIHTAMVIGTLVAFVVFVFVGRSTSQAPGTGLTRQVIPLLVPALAVFYCYRHARWMRRFAVAIDLKEKICPACGYPLTLQDKENSLTDSICTECGRRWNVAE